MFEALLRRIRGDNAGPDMKPVYAGVVSLARQPHWYLDGGVEDSVNGRFEMVIAILTVALTRIEAEGEAGQLPAVRLTETFVDDMDGQLREFGVGDVVVGKHVGKMMGALGGRIAAYRGGLADGDDRKLLDAIRRNLHRGEEKGECAVTHCAHSLCALHTRLSGLQFSDLMDGKEMAQ